VTAPTESEIEALAEPITKRQLETAVRLIGLIGNDPDFQMIRDEIAVALAEEFRHGTQFARKVFE
jgi:hypothetical protein